MIVKLSGIQKRTLSKEFWNTCVRLIGTTIFLLIIALLNTNTTAQEKPAIDYFLDGAIISEITGNEKELWIATYGRGVFHYNQKNDKWENYSVSNGKVQQDFFYCITFNDDYVWAGSSDGLFTFDRKKDSWRKRKFGMGGELGNWIRAVEYDKYLNVVWIGRFKYLTKLNISTQRFNDYDLSVRGNTKTNNIKSIKLDGDSLVWFAAEEGIHKYNKALDIENKASLKYFDNKNNNFNGDGDVVSVSDILFESGKIWFGLEEFVTIQKPNYNVGGIYEFDRKVGWDRYAKENGLPGNGVFCMARTGNILWASIYEFNKKNKEQTGQGIALIDRISKNISYITKDDLNLKSDKILSMFFDGKNMWLGTNSGLLKIKIVNEFAYWPSDKQSKAGKKSKSSK